VFRKDAQLYKRRGEKIITTLASCFTAHYILNFEKLLGKKMEGIPTFDGRWVVYPDKAILKDYLSWR
jgi:tRNA(His) guanylyltransferase